MVQNLVVMREASGPEVHQEEAQRRHLIRFELWFVLYLYYTLVFGAANRKVQCSIIFMYNFSNYL